MSVATVVGALFIIVGLGLMLYGAAPMGPSAAERFGCAHNYINDRGEDTGECQ